MFRSSETSSPTDTTRLVLSTSNPYALGWSRDIVPKAEHQRIQSIQRFPPTPPSSPPRRRRTPTEAKLASLLRSQLSFKRRWSAFHETIEPGGNNSGLSSGHGCDMTSDPTDGNSATTSVGSSFSSNSQSEGSNSVGSGISNVPVGKKRRYFEVDRDTGEERITEITERPATSSGVSEKRFYPVPRFPSLIRSHSAQDAGQLAASKATKVLHNAVRSIALKVPPRRPTRHESPSHVSSGRTNGAPTITPRREFVDVPLSTQVDTPKGAQAGTPTTREHEPLLQASSSGSSVSSPLNSSTCMDWIVKDSMSSVRTSPSAPSASIRDSVPDDQRSAGDSIAASETSTAGGNVEIFSGEGLSAESTPGPTPDDSVSQDACNKQSNASTGEGKARRPPPPPLSLAADAGNFATLASSRIRRQSLNVVPKTPIPVPVGRSRPSKSGLGTPVRISLNTNSQSPTQTKNSHPEFTVPQYTPLPPISPVRESWETTVPAEVSERVIQQHVALYMEKHQGEAPSQRSRRRKVKGGYRLPVPMDEPNMEDFIIVNHREIKYWRDESSEDEAASGIRSGDDGDTSSSTDVERWVGGNVKGPKPKAKKRRDRRRPEAASRISETVADSCTGKPTRDPILTAAPKQSELHPILTAAPKQSELHPILTAAPKQSVHPILTAAPKQSDLHPILTAAPKQSDLHPIPTAVPKQSDVHPTLTAAPKQSDLLPILTAVPKQSDLRPTLKPVPKQSDLPGKGKKVATGVGARPRVDTIVKPKPTRKLSSLIVEDEGMLVEDPMDLDYGSDTLTVVNSRPGSRGSLTKPLIGGQLPVSSTTRRPARQSTKGRSSKMSIYLPVSTAASPYPFLSDTEISSDEDIIPAASAFGHATATFSSSRTHQSRELRNQQRIDAIRYTEGGPNGKGFDPAVPTIFSIAQLGVVGVGVMGPPAAKMSLAEYKMYIGRKGDQVPLFGSGGNMVVQGLVSNSLHEAVMTLSDDPHLNTGGGGPVQPGGVVEVRRVEDPLLEATMEVKRLIAEGGQLPRSILNHGILGGLNVEKVYWSGEREASLTKPQFGIGVDFSGQPLVKAITFSNALNNNTYTLTFVWGFLPVNTPEKNKENAVGNSMLLSDEVKGDGANDTRSDDVRESFQVHLCVGKPGRSQKKEDRKRIVFVQILNGEKNGTSHKRAKAGVDMTKWERWELDGLMTGLRRLWLEKVKMEGGSTAMGLPRTLKRGNGFYHCGTSDTGDSIGTWLEREVLGVQIDGIAREKTNSASKPNLPKPLLKRSKFPQENANKSMRLPAPPRTPLRVPGVQSTLPMYLQGPESRAGSSAGLPLPPKSPSSPRNYMNGINSTIYGGGAAFESEAVRRARHRKEVLWEEMCREVLADFSDAEMEIEDDSDWEHMPCWRL